MVVCASHTPAWNVPDIRVEARDYKYALAYYSLKKNQALIGFINDCCYEKIIGKINSILASRDS